jgi:hypothetical protein
MHRSFRSSLQAGQDAERRWVDSLRAIGRAVAHGLKLRIKKHCKVNDHVESPDACLLLSVEIKERSLSFTSPEDYPYDTVFVDDCRGLARESFGHFAYVYLSKPTGQWVWLSVLDRDETWTETTTFDRGRGHEVPVLVAPKGHLRPAQQLIDLIYPHHFLDLVDGETGAFVSGGGEVAERERYVAKTHPDAGGRVTPPPGKSRKHMG